MNGYILFLLLVGAVSSLIGYLMDGTSSFDDGSFTRQMFFTIFGIIAFAIGLILLVLNILLVAQ